MSRLEVKWGEGGWGTQEKGLCSWSRPMGQLQELGLQVNERGGGTSVMMPGGGYGGRSASLEMGEWGRFGVYMGGGGRQSHLVASWFSVTP